MRIAVVFFLICFSAISVIAQESWRVEERCMANLSYPIVRQGNWDFPGVIISSVYPHGIHGIRADRDVEYFIALESDDTFAAAGVISPDGHYFAYPIGETDFGVNSVGDDLLGVRAIRVVRTDGNTDETYRFDVHNYTYAGIGRSFNLDSTIWLGSNWIYYPDLGVTPFQLHDFLTGEIKEWDLSVYPHTLKLISPDGTRAFSDVLYDLENDKSLTYSAPQHLTWFADSSAFLASDETKIELVDRNGIVIDTIEQQGVTDIAISPDSKLFAFWDEQQNLFIADMEQKIIYNLCFEGNNGSASFLSQFYPNLAWSPNNQLLAFSYDEYLVILNTQTLENQVIDHYSLQVMAWVSLD